MDDLSRPPPDEALSPAPDEAPSPDPPRSSRRQALAQLVARTPDALAAAAHHLRAWGALAAFIALSPGLLLWPMMNVDRLPMFVDNKLPLAERWAFVAWVLCLAVPTLVGYGVVGVRTARRLGPEAVTVRLTRLNDWLAPLALLPLIPPLCLPKIETTAPWLAHLLPIIGGAWAARIVYRFPWRPRLAPDPDAPIHKYGPLLLVLVLAMTYGVVFTLLSVTQHRALGSSIFDLGLYDNILWHTSRGDLLASSFIRGGSHVSAHVDPILALIAPLYWFAPGSETALAVQSFWLATAAVPAWLLCRHHLGRPWLSVLFAATLLLYPAMHGANLYDFHSLTLAAPTVLWLLFALETRRWKLFGGALVLLLLTREDLSLLTCFVGAYAVLSGRARRVGLATIGLALAYFLFVKIVVMPDAGIFMKDSKEAYGYAYYYVDLIPEGRGGLRALLASLLTNPIFVLKHVFTEPKILFFLKLFGPLLCLPFLAHRGKVMMLYGFAFLFLASRAPVFSTHFQYPVVLFPIAFALTPLALAELDRSRLVSFFVLDARRLVPALLVGVFVSGATLSAKYGALLPSDAFRGGFTRLNRTLDSRQTERYAFLSAQLAEIPPDASISASQRVGAHASSREKAAMFPDGWGHDFVLVEPGSLDPGARRAFNTLKSSGAYVSMGEKHGLAIYRRNPEKPLPNRPK